MIINNFISLFFPKICGACYNIILNDDELCVECDVNLIYKSKPTTNKIQKVFKGKLKIEKSAFLIDFNKKERIQKALHSIKYKNKKKLAIYIAEELTLKLGLDFFQDINCIIPVPLHTKKIKHRKFNQSDLIAKGIQNITSIPIYSKCITRIKQTESQTNKNRIERIQNVKDAFKVVNVESIKNKHILIVDDVFTTGATLESCIKYLQKKANCMCSIITLDQA